MTSAASSCQIPTIDAICGELALSSEQKTEFLQSAHQWRREFKFLDGSFGKDLIDWSCGRTQRRLSRMTLAYLDRGGNGIKWWSPAGPNDTEGPVAYPRDITFIARSLRYIFYRQNVNPSHNIDRFWGPQDKAHITETANPNCNDDGLQTTRSSSASRESNGPDTPISENNALYVPQHHSQEEIHEPTSSVVQLHCRHESQGIMEGDNRSSEFRPSKIITLKSNLLRLPKPQLVPMGNAPVANMVRNPDRSFNGSSSPENFNQQLRSRSQSHLDAREHGQPASDDDRDEDYVDEGPRKSHRPRRPTEKARRRRVRLTLRQVQKDRNASVFPPGFDRGRFPLQRRKTRSDKGRKTRSDKGVPKKRRLSRTTTASGLFSGSLSSNELAKDESGISCGVIHATDEQPTGDVEMIDSSADNDLEFLDLDKEDLSQLLLTPPMHEHTASNKRSSEYLSDMTLGSATASPQVLQLQYKREALQHERTHQQLQSQPSAVQFDHVIQHHDVQARSTAVMNQSQPSITLHPAHDVSENSMTSTLELGDGSQGLLAGSDVEKRSIAPACGDCRKKKVKCDGKMPVCVYCSSYSPECFLTPQIEKMEDPSNDRLVACDALPNHNPPPLSPSPANKIAPGQNGEPPSSSSHRLDVEDSVERLATDRSNECITTEPTDADEQLQSSLPAEYYPLASSPAPSRILNIHSNCDTPESSTSDNGGSKRREALPNATPSNNHGSAEPILASTLSSASPGPQIRYIIIKSRTPRLNKQHWKAGSLRGKTFDQLCDEVALLIGRVHIQRIDFELISETIQCEDSVDREQPADFDTMRDNFREEMIHDMEEHGTLKFDIQLEPDVGSPSKLEPATPTKRKLGDVKAFNPW